MEKNSFVIPGLVEVRFEVLRMFEGREDTKFVLAEHGLGYKVAVLNLTGRRLLAQMAIDRVDTMSGQPANCFLNGGMVCSAYGPTSFDGWRQDNATVGAFKFTLNDSQTVSVQLNNEKDALGIIEFTFIQEVKPIERFDYGILRDGSPKSQVTLGLEGFRGAESFGLGKSSGSVGTGMGGD